VIAHTRAQLNRESERITVVIRSNNDTTIVIHPRDCARDRRAFHAAHELRAIIFTSVVYLRARIIRRASGWNEIPFGPRSLLIAISYFFPGEFHKDIFLGANRAPRESPRPRRKLRPRPRWSLESGFRRCIRTRYKGYRAARSTLQLRLDPFYRPPVSLILKYLSKVLSIEKRYMGKKMK